MTKHSIISNNDIEPNKMPTISILDLIFFILLFLMVGVFLKDKFYSYQQNELIQMFTKSHPEHSLNDLLKIKIALENYFIKYGKYPKSEGFDGIKSCWGKSDKNWINGLVPEFLPYLPDNIKKSDQCDKQYLYFSNESAYKIISHKPEDCKEIKKILPASIDPNRNCWAYGFWSKNASYY